MSTQVRQAMNSSAALRVGAEFSFAKGATTVAAAIAAGYAQLGNILEVTPQANTTKVETHDTNRGSPRKIRSDLIESSLEFNIKTNEFTKETARFLIGGEDDTVARGTGSTAGQFTQTVQSTVSADALAFNTTAAKLGYWYPITVSGARVINATVVTIATLTEGTDFEIDLRMGNVRFLTAQAASRVPVVTAPAITASSTGAFFTFIPGQTYEFTGMGRLYFFDKDSANPVPLWWENFSCQITLDSVANLTPKTFADLTFKVLITDDVGVAAFRYGLAAIT